MKNISSETRVIDLTVSDLIQVIKSNSIPNTTPNNKKKWLTLNELCYEFSFKASTVYGWVMQRRIPFVKKGKSLLFDREQIESWLIQSKKVNLLMK
ncbi:MAG: helix-turn-helix domain-containing protein [Candidatus Atribacteria bacterium]|nr:helix-turn-helix domain-containing protein [Candidatus Atribacteria bacterium]